MKETLGRPDKSEVHESLSGEEEKIKYIDLGSGYIKVTVGDVHGVF